MSLAGCCSTCSTCAATTTFVGSTRRGQPVFDPTAGMDETSTLVMRRDLSHRLSSAGYGVFWTVLLNKLRNDHTYHRPGPANTGG